MSHSRDAGNISTLILLILLLLGTMMMIGLSLYLTSQRQWITKEITSIVRYAGAQSALAWGEWQSWTLHHSWQCQTDEASAQRACVYLTQDNEALLVGFLVDGFPNERLVHWRWGELKNGKFIASTHGWLDYCPLSNETVCNLPS